MVANNPQFTKDVYIVDGMRTPFLKAGVNAGLFPLLIWR